MKQVATIIIVIAVLIIGSVLIINSRDNKDNKTADNNMESTEGRVVFSVTDAAANMSNISEITMTINKVEMHSTAEGWVTIESSNKAFNLLALKAGGEHAFAGDATVAAGTYDQVQVGISKIIVTTTDGKTAEAKLPSGELRINSTVVIVEGQTSTVSLDFIADASLHVTGQGGYIFAPVVQAESRSNAAATVSSDNKVTVTGGTVVSLVNVGVDISGEVKANFKIDPKTKLDLESNGIIKIGI